ncbi:MAG: ComF family protein [Chitinophagaceae bacterium]|jgi:ComF family protein|nr:ComF family protein [Chitinophagaceae bacterium]OQY95174.1 MAG: phosphoribosyltransferase [Sphingobacteriales bacterium UTBCD1]
MISFQEIKESFLHFLFPHICSGCGSDLLANESNLCMYCIHALPETNFEIHPDNPVEKKFWGRLPVESATAQYYFTKESLMQNLIHQMKYRKNKELGLQLGRLMGNSIKQSGRFAADALIPLPLFPAKEKRRGYNQSMLLCEGMKTTMKIPVLTDVISRPQFTETQTKKGRIERWMNLEGKFLLLKPEAIQNKHILLVDDVVTTGATLESCGSELIKAGNTRLSIATLCYASR